MFINEEEWLTDAKRRLDAIPEQAKKIRELAENDLFFFAKLLNPRYLYGSIHKDLFLWLQEYNLYGIGSGISSNKLIMLPRAHLKSHMVAVWCVWMIARHPEITILYLSATSDLAVVQLYDIKNMLESRPFQKYWPEYIHPESGKREKWTEKRIIIDHPKRKEEGIRDATISTAGLTTNTTGWHADVIVSDDIVVPDNAYTEEGRESVSKKTSQFTSIRNAGGFTISCGTRYHPADIYKVFKEQVVESYNDDDEYLGKELVWDIREHAVEEDNVFLWPRTVRKDGKSFGYNLQVLNRIKAEYSDKTQFYAQYYNNPNDPSSDRLDRSLFQYFSPKFLKKDGDRWFYNGKRLNTYAAVDFAYSLNSNADYTAIVVIGMDSDKNIYVLEIDRFKSTKTIEYFQHTARLHAKWYFKKLNAEVTGAQKTIVESIKEYIKNAGMKLSVIEFRPSSKEGSKEERIAAILEHRYENQEIWHEEGGWTGILEDELISKHPVHDDIKDALASAVSIAVPPMRSASDRISGFFTSTTNNNRFGGFQ